MKKGNCIDDYIERGVEKYLDQIVDKTLDIKSRVDIRTNNNEYHNTACYEHDFSDIVDIRNIAQKIVDKANLHLSRISEFYTKFKYE